MFYGEKVFQLLFCTKYIVKILKTKKCFYDETTTYRAFL